MVRPTKRPAANAAVSAIATITNTNNNSNGRRESSACSSTNATHAGTSVNQPATSRACFDRNKPSGEKNKLTAIHNHQEPATA
ncbi:MAG: hypothetical protein A2W18_00930 [Candidatus Muproteobacteria bacterium RBG_16_60_9]|uniref:Uncharacterized protein n=1 Tax=Candidatus Muproteobacteria bacterium RBG_16_60_9 TaxID=1817755 RepID=A0A1F6UXE7_9PROT|nr:MAG: hypothetical protein A2W18_00930 [Candidatus Muproteobacteria bacterium RBG_16_60_9]